MSLMHALTPSVCILDDVDMHRTAASYIKPDYLSLWLCRVIAADIATDKDGRILTAAAKRLPLLRSVNPHGKVYHDRWAAAIKAGSEAVMTLLCDTSEEAQPLRSSSPFVMDQAVRDRVLVAFRAWWASQATDGDFLLANRRRGC
jgi:hypothetical protein